MRHARSQVALGASMILIIVLTINGNAQLHHLPTPTAMFPKPRALLKATAIRRPTTLATTTTPAITMDTTIPIMGHHTPAILTRIHLTLILPIPTRLILTRRLILLTRLIPTLLTHPVVPTTTTTTESIPTTPITTTTTTILPTTTTTTPTATIMAQSQIKVILAHAVPSTTLNRALIFRDAIGLALTAPAMATTDMATVLSNTPLKPAPEPAGANGQGSIARRAATTTTMAVELAPDATTPNLVPT